MGIRTGKAVHLSIACAMIGSQLSNLEDYFFEKSLLAELVHDLATQHRFREVDVAVNAADDRETGTIYLTVTGTSAEAGDDGEVGRGNRVNGLITPGRPMSLEAAAGKNPVTHVGKIYNVVARAIAASLVEDIPEISSAQCLLVSRIGSPVTQPALIDIKLTVDGVAISELEHQVKEIAERHLYRIPELIDDFVAGKIQIF